MNLRVARLENVQRQALFEAIYLQKRLASEQQISEFQTRFLAMIHHELRTPLSVIRLALGMKNASPKVKSHAIEAVRNIDIILERCSLSQRLDHAPITPNIKEVEIYSFIENALTKMPGQHRLQLNESHDIPGYVVKTDPDLLRILLNNVIENALKYAVEESMIDIAIARRFEFFECCITISNRLEHPEEVDISKIFERYVRTASAAKHSGSGLGLYIAKGLAESLNGEITCTVDKGIIHFEICL
jgi:signal transduction histidine kinase